MLSITKHKLISISLSPNIEKDDIQLVSKLIFSPWKWKKGEAVQKLEEEFKEYLGVKYAFAFNSGRSAYLAILNSLGLKKESKILLQAYTCNAAINPIIWSGFNPVFIDIDDTMNLDPEDLQKKIRPETKVVIIQHTFGNPAKVDEILEICKQHNLILIEDCAHSLGAKYRGQKVGAFGKAAFFSFSRDKVISSVFGGMAVTNDDEIAKKIKEFQEKWDYPTSFWVFQQLLHPILVNYLILPFYGFFGLGKYILIGFQKLKILSKAVHKIEKQGRKPGYFSKKMPDALAILALNQFKKLERFNQHRKEIAEFYNEELKNTDFVLPKRNEDTEPIFMRYSILLPDYLDSDLVLKEARQENILLDDGWRKTPIVPPGTNLDKMKYISGSCPQAEKTAKTILNLPTHINISKEHAQKIVDLLRDEMKK